MTVNRTEARRLYKQALEQLARLDLQLFALDDADQLSLVEADQRREMEAVLRRATDTMAALVRVDAIAQALVEPVDMAVKAALEEPTAVASMPGNDIECPEEEAYHHLLVLRGLAARLAMVYGLDIEEASHGLTTPQNQLRRICENIGQSILYLKQKGVIETPKREHDVKHVLFACVPSGVS